MATEWKASVLPGIGGDGLPEGYRREGRIIGRQKLLESDGRNPFSESDFVGRAQVPYTTSLVEARIRHRQLERVFQSTEIDRSQPVLELGCADGVVTRHLLELGFNRLVSTDIVHAAVERLDSSLSPGEAEKVVLVVDDLLQLPLEPKLFEAVIAWGVLSVSGEFDRALELSWGWVAPGGYLLLAEPTLESVLVYALVRGDLEEFGRILETGTRAAMWDGPRRDRYRVHRWSFYEQQLGGLHGATMVDRGGVSMLPSLVLGGIAQDSSLPEAQLQAFSGLLGAPSLDDLTLWRQAYWLVRKT